MQDSLEVARDFCKSMLSSSFAAIPIYVALVKFALPDRFRPDAAQAALLLAPAFAFLSAAVAFLAGYLPRTATFSLDIPEEIEATIRSATRHRLVFALVGFALFVIAIVFGSIATGWALGRPVPKP